MGSPDGSRYVRARLVAERLEDRTTPSSLNDPVDLILPEVTRTGIAADRVTVVMDSPVNTVSDASLLASPFAADVSALGFGIYSVSLTSGTDLSNAVHYYNSLPGVLSAAPDEVVRLQATPNDTYYPSLYGL